jgi:hypothetical protein
LVGWGAFVEGGVNVGGASVRTGDLTVNCAVAVTSPTVAAIS